MNKHQVARKQEMIRRILIITIFVLLAVFLVLLFVLLLSKGRPSNPANSGIMATKQPENTANTTYYPETTPGASVEPDESVAPVFSELPSVEPIITVPPEQYGIAHVVTEGTINDVMARLEQFKNLPESETLILLDVGHGGFDGGTSGTETGITEAELNLQVSRILAQKLGEKGYYVFMTRMGDYGVADSKNDDMKMRKQIMKLQMFDCSVSIHMNALADDRSVHGVRLYHYKEGTEGEKLAKSILQSICELTDETRTNTNTGNLMVVREPVMPSALVECGFLTNPEDERKLCDPAYQQVLAQAIANGVENYLNGNKAQCQ